MPRAFNPPVSLRAVTTNMIEVAGIGKSARSGIPRHTDIVTPFIFGKYYASMSTKTSGSRCVLHSRNEFGAKDSLSNCMHAEVLQEASLEFAGISCGH